MRIDTTNIRPSLRRNPKFFGEFTPRGSKRSFAFIHPTAYHFDEFSTLSIMKFFNKIDVAFGINRQHGDTIWKHHADMHTRLAIRPRAVIFHHRDPRSAVFYDRCTDGPCASFALHNDHIVPKSAAVHKPACRQAGPSPT